MMNVLVLGGTGFIGARVVRRLAAEGHAVAVFHRGRTHADLPDGVTHLHGDRAQLLDHVPAFRRFAPDVVLDVIPYTQAHAEAAMRAFRDLAGRIVVLSSSDVYRNYDGFRGASGHAPDPTPLAEDAPLRETRFPYRGYEGLDFAHAEDYDKILVERAVSNDPDLPAAVLRLPAVCGPGDRQHRFFPYLKRMDDGRPFVLLGEREAAWRWTHGYVENVAAAVALAVIDARTAGRTYNLGEAKTPTVAERVRMLGAAVGWSGAVETLPAEQLPEHLQTPLDYRYDLATDTRRFWNDFGFTPPVASEEALRRTAAWLRAHPPEPMPLLGYAAEDAAIRSAP